MTIAFTSQPGRPEIVHCTDGEDFLKFLQTAALDEISFVLLDLNMPRLSGIEVLEIISEHKDWKKLPIIVFTSSAFEKDINTCYDLGANAYVVKPVEFDELDRKLAYINSFWTGVNLKPHFPEPSAS